MLPEIQVIRIEDLLRDQAGTLVDDFANISFLTMLIRDTDSNGALLLEKVVSEFDSVSWDDWSNGEGQHFEIALTREETSFPIEIGEARKLWIAFAVTTTSAPGQDITLGGTQLTVLLDGIGCAEGYTASEGIAYSKAEADARFQVAGTALSYFQFIYAATLAEGDFGYFVAPADCSILGVSAYVQGSSIGGSIVVDLTLDGDEQSKTVSISAAANEGSATFGSAMEVEAGQVLRAKIIQVGLTEPGEFLTLTLNVRPA